MPSYHLGVTYWLLRRPEDARVSLERPTLQPGHAETLYYLGLTRARRDSCPRPSPISKRRRAAPSLAIAYAHLGVAQRELGDLDARASLRRALELEPGRFDALNALGLTLMQRAPPTKPSRPSRS